MVLEDAFPAGRPRWEAVGVQLTDDVEPYELMKLRLLNAGHQAIAFAGHLSGRNAAETFRGTAADVAAHQREGTRTGQGAAAMAESIRESLQRLRSERHADHGPPQRHDDGGEPPQ